MFNACWWLPGFCSSSGRPGELPSINPVPPYPPENRMSIFRLRSRTSCSNFPNIWGSVALGPVNVIVYVVKPKSTILLASLLTSLSDFSACCSSHKQASSSDGTISHSSTRSIVVLGFMHQKSALLGLGYKEKLQGFRWRISMVSKILKLVCLYFVLMAIF